TFANPFAANVVDTSLVCKNFVYTSEANLSIKWDNEVENYENISLNPASLNFVTKRFSKSNLVSITVDGETSGDVAEAFGGLDGKAFITMDGGYDGSMDTINAGTFIGEDKGPGKRTGIQSFIENNHVNIMAVPGITIPEVLVTLVAHCENMSNRFAVLDMPKEAVKIDDIMEVRNLIDSTFAAFYHPWVQVFDRVNQKSTFVPPSGAIMGVYARSDIERGVHKAPANET
ncbi:MAG: phage tail sheath subtilisin-like domain-containing protein, partial [Oscillospiraceae bacterium]